MKNLITILFLIVLVACDTATKSRDVEKEKEIEKNDSLSSQSRQNEIDNQANNTVDNKASEIIDEGFKKELIGLWADKGYFKNLKRYNSIVTADSLADFYTELVFTGDSIIYCNEPQMMEPDYYKLRSDSSIVDYENELSFKIISISDTNLIVKSKIGELREYKKIKNSDELDSDAIHEVVMGTVNFITDWISGNYIFQADTTTFSVEFTKNGGLNGHPTYNRFRLYNFQNHDLIEFSKGGDYLTSLAFTIDSFKNDTINLTEIAMIEDIDDVIKQTDRKYKLVRK